MSVLFVCTGNYYRSRFAEIYYNHIYKPQSSGLAYSRGFEVYKSNNPGPISPHTIDYLQRLDIKVVDPRFPLQLKRQDFTRASEVILMDKTEHLPMLQRYFPEFKINRLITWDFPDIQFREPNEILPALKISIERLHGKDQIPER
jgi:protein-tyrosine phosphatase